MKIKFGSEGAPKVEIFLFILFFLFSWALMWKTFRTSPEGNMQIATKAWSDFGATIPLIRSFSFGDNFPPQYPIFAGPPIRYHFIFYFLVGILEKAGLPISWALNLPSILGFTVLLFLIYSLSKYIFKSRIVGILSTFFFAFNGSFSFLEFFQKHPLSFNTLWEITRNLSFPSFGPYDGKTVSAFWNLNIYTNQRHLALAYSFFLLLALYFYKKSEREENPKLGKTFFLGILVGIFPFVHYAVFGMLEVLIGTVFVFFPKVRKEAFIIGLTSIFLAVPQIMYMGGGDVDIHLLKPGYLVENLSFSGFLSYWFLNFGLASILAPLGFIFADKKQRKIFLPFLALFVIGNIFQFSPEIAANHKFFNLSLIGINMFAAFSIIKLYQKSVLLLPVVISIVFFMILSGIIDFFPVFNDSHVTIEDIPNNKAATFIKENTPKSSVFLNSSFLYHPASLAGRKIFIGWPYFAWSAGYDTEKRGQILRRIFTTNSKVDMCRLLKQENIDYLTVQDTGNDPNFPPIDLPFFSKNFLIDYSDSTIQIISVAKNCPY